jgi:hypothetical protein
LYDAANWLSARQVLDIERTLLEELDAAARDAAMFDALAYDRFEDPELGFDPDPGCLEFGVAGLTLMLCSAGFVTASSCRGHHSESGSLPYVLFRADGGRIRLLAELVPEHGCALTSDLGTLVIAAPSVRNTISLASAILDRATSFGARPALQPSISGS